MLGGHHDIVPTVTAGPSGVVYAHQQAPATDDVESAAPHPEEPPRKRRRVETNHDDPFINYLRERDVVDDIFRQSLLSEMASVREAMTQYMDLMKQVFNNNNG